MVRPQVRLAGDRVVLRDMLSTVPDRARGGRRGRGSAGAGDARRRAAVRLRRRVEVALPACSRTTAACLVTRRPFPTSWRTGSLARSEDERARLGLARGEVPLDVRRGLASAGDRAPGAVRPRSAGRSCACAATDCRWCAQDSVVVDAAQVVDDVGEAPRRGAQGLQPLDIDHLPRQGLRLRSTHADNTAMIKGTHEGARRAWPTDPDSFSEGWIVGDARPGSRCRWIAPTPRRLRAARRGLADERAEAGRGGRRRRARD